MNIVFRVYFDGMSNLLYHNRPNFIHSCNQNKYCLLGFCSHRAQQEMNEKASNNFNLKIRSFKCCPLSITTMVLPRKKLLFANLKSWEKCSFLSCASNAIMIAYQVMVIYSLDFDVRTLECQPSIKAGEFQRRESNTLAEILLKNNRYKMLESNKIKLSQVWIRLLILERLLAKET